MTVLEERIGLEECEACGAGVEKLVRVPAPHDPEESTIGVCQGCAEIGPVEDLEREAISDMLANVL